MLLRYVHAARVLVLTTFMVGLATITFAAPAQADGFDDTSGENYDSAVQSLAAQEVIVGCGDGQFCPADSVSRGQMASILVQALELPAAQDAGRFDDVAGTTHEDNINALAEAGIAAGCAPDRFCPTEEISREQMATFLVEGFDLPATDVTHFDDTTGMHAGAVDIVAEAGITSGCDRALTDFCPRSDILRSQAAVFLARALDLEPRAELASLDERRAQQAEIDAEEQRRLEAEREAARQAEIERQEAEAERREAERLQMWERLAQCESGGNWSINTGNGYYGGLQFSLSSWQWVGGSGYPHKASRAEQIRRGEILLDRQGWNAWPACSRKLGYR